MHTDIATRVQALRAWMQAQKIDAFIVPSTDPHNSEYPADHWKCREWLTGFDGSAGTAIVTLDEAALWTDSRYFLQAEQQLVATPFRLMKEGEPATPTLVQWLNAQAAGKPQAFRWGFVAQAMPLMLWEELRSAKAEWVACPDVFVTLWSNRPALPCAPIYEQPLVYAGETTASKLQHIRQASEQRWDFYLLNDLSEIAWILNLRGADIAYNPLFMSYLIVKREGGAVLFVDEAKLDEAVRAYLLQHSVELRPYEGVATFLMQYPPQQYTYVHAQSLSVDLFSLLQKEVSELSWGDQAPLNNVATVRIDELRARKNSDEIAGFRRAMELDGVALVKFRRWLDERVSSGRIRKETEHSVAQKLEALRAEAEEFRGLSFATIAGYAANGAIVHYEPTAAQHAQLDSRGLLLLDSGAQYTCGTTDITRTIALGELTEEERRVYTLVLKGHIALSRARFPEGTTGLQLDLAARYAMWQEGYDFGHGTGHGVGSHLCVHEGPQQIRKNLRACTQVPFEVGMTITNEPGIYLPHQFGVRIENVLLCQPCQDTAFGRFLHFETLTLCPIDTAPIDLSMLDAMEVAWLNAYHKSVRRGLLPLLSNEADRQWLLAATAEM